MPRPTIEDVAAGAGVSVTTVSHVFSGHRPVSEATQLSVRDIAAKLGYRPNAVARSLRARRTNTVMVVVPDITNGFYPEYARGIQDVLRAGDYHVLLCNTDAVEAEERMALEEARARRLDGIAFVGFRVSAVDLEPLAAEGMAVVVTGRPHGAEGIDAVRFDDVAASAEATRFVLDRYGPKTAMICAGTESAVGSRRLEGFRKACADFGAAAEAAPAVLEEFTRAGGLRGMERLMALPTRPRSVVCANDMIALGAIDMARELALDVPGDVAIIGRDDVDAATIVRPRLTTIRTDAGQLGENVARLLLDRMEAEFTGPGREVVLPHRLVIRESA
jgi:DNA-binding LacI/PurR family transcriptional regulator